AGPGDPRAAGAAGAGFRCRAVRSAGPAADADGAVVAGEEPDAGVERADDQHPAAGEHPGPGKPGRARAVVHESGAAGLRTGEARDADADADPDPTAVADPRAAADPPDDPDAARRAVAGDGSGPGAAGGVRAG